jgi:hypothetical protein
MHREISSGLLFLLVWAASPVELSAQALFDFEDEAISGTVRAFSMSEAGITASFWDPGRDSYIQDLSGLVSRAPLSWGERSFTPAAFGRHHQIIDFSTPLTSFSIEFGDFGGPGGTESDFVHLRAWSEIGGTGTILDSDDVFYSGESGFPNDIGVASVANELGFRSIEFWEDGSSTANDVHFDNMVVIAVPEPLTLASVVTLAIIGSAFRWTVLQGYHSSPAGRASAL